MRGALIVLVLLLLPLSGSMHAQENLIRGGLVIPDPVVGYGGFALPVANSALGRSWAEGTKLAWQAGYNYSAVPVRVDIEHSMPNAYTGRIEVVSPTGYALAEDPLQHETAVSKEFIVPASVPRSVMLAPRVCPASSPGAPVELIVRYYQGNNAMPIYEFSKTVIQLEPAHLYSLLLDGPPGGKYLDRVNPDNALALEMPESLEIAPEVLQSDLWTLSVDRRQVTLLPLAARDFAFVVADYQAVKSWPVEEQEALSVFMVGGGYLCLYNVEDDGWLGLNLAGGPRPVGRGYLLPVPAGFTAARQEIIRWLEGELSEFVLWAGGASGGESLTYLRNGSEILAQQDTLAFLAVPSDQPEIISHRPGFLHPVWIYRETCRSQAGEPWEYPEFMLPDTAAWRANANLTDLPNRRDDPRLVPLAFRTQPGRNLPQHFFWLLALVPVLVFSFGIKFRLIWMFRLALLAAFAAGCYSWWGTQPIPPNDVRLRVIDQDYQAIGMACREITAATARQDQQVLIEVPDHSLVRHVSWGVGSAGPWKLDQDRDGSYWRGRSETVGPAPGNAWRGAVVSSDSPFGPEVQSPVRLQLMPGYGGVQEIHLDTRQLPADQNCYLQTPFGWTVVPGGITDGVVRVTLPEAVPAFPGLERLRILDELAQTWLPVQRSNGTIMEFQTDALLKSSGFNRAIEREDLDLVQLGFMGLIQSPTSLAGVMHMQGSLIAKLPNAENAPANTEEESFVRISFPLGMSGR